MSYNNYSSERRGGSGCFTCGKDGHIARNCPQGGDGGGGGGGPRFRTERNTTCYSCGKEGHISSQCRGGGGGRGGGYGGSRGGDRDRGYGGGERKVYNDGKPTLFVRNLTEEATSDVLKDVFPDAINWRIPNNFNGYAFVEYDSDSKMENDLNEKQNYSLHGNNLFISRSINNSSRGGGGGGGYRSNAPYNANNRNGGGGYYGSRGGRSGGGYRNDREEGGGGGGYNSGGSD